MRAIKLMTGPSSSFINSQRLAVIGSEMIAATVDKLRSALLLLLFVGSVWSQKMATVSVVSAATSYGKMTDGRCLFTNVSMSSSTAFNDLQCSALCNQNASCMMYMVKGDKCYLYAGMRPSFYNAVSYNASSLSECRLYTAGWGQCPPSPYVFNDKYYYINKAYMSSTQALAFCLSNSQLMLKIDSYAEAWYLGQVVMFNNAMIPIWIGLFGSSYSNNLTWVADGSSFNTSSIPQIIWTFSKPAYLQAYCYYMSGGSTPPFYIYDEYCNSTTSTHYPVCTCA